MIKIKKRGLLLVAGIVWLAAGTNILRIGIMAMLSSWKKGALCHNITLLFSALLILVGFSFMFYRITGKNERRMMGYAAEKVSVFQFFDLKGYLMMAFMMVLGIVLRRGNFLPNYFFAFFYTGLGSALSIAGIRFGIHFFKITIRQVLWLSLGLLSVTLGTIGIFLPILPTVPLYLLAAFAFLSSSKRLYANFKRSRLHNRFLKPYIDRGGLTKKAKRRLVLFVSVQIGIAAFLIRGSVIGLCVLAFVYLGFLVSMLLLVKTISPIDQNNKKE